MRDKRYIISRQCYGYFRRTDVAGFKALDDAERHRYKPKPLFGFWSWFVAGSCYAIIISGLIYAIMQRNRQPPPKPEPSSYELARDDAARERAAQFVRTLGFEPGPAACRSKRDGSAWCTIRVAGSDKTFALWCSDEHPMCIEDVARE